MGSKGPGPKQALCVLGSPRIDRYSSHKPSAAEPRSSQAAPVHPATMATLIKTNKARPARRDRRANWARQPPRCWSCHRRRRRRLLAPANPHHRSALQMFGGFVRRYEHESAELGCRMVFSVFFPPQAANAPVPVRCTLSQGAGAPHHARPYVAAHPGLASPRPHPTPTV